MKTSLALIFAIIALAAWAQLTTFPQPNNHSIGNVSWTAGAGSPEGVVTAPLGSIYSRTDGGYIAVDGVTNWTPSLYVKELGSGNTG